MFSFINQIVSKMNKIVRLIKVPPRVTCDTKQTDKANALELPDSTANAAVNALKSLSNLLCHPAPCPEVIHTPLCHSRSL